MSATTTDVDRFRRILSWWLGLRLDSTAADTLDELLAERVAATGHGDVDAYLDNLGTDRPAAERAALAARLTVPETYFFRNGEQFEALADVVVPARMRTDATLRLLSAGCATGEEPYTLAIVAREAVQGRGFPAGSVSVVGVDLNPAVLERAARGRFTAWSLRATPEPVQRRWFRPDGAETVLDPEIRRGVRFVAGNLADDDADWWAPGHYDVIFCRNVIMYLTPRHAAAVMARLVTALAPDGFLFLGHAETNFGRIAGLDLRHSNNTFYFQRGAPTEQPTGPPAERPRKPEKREQPEPTPPAARRRSVRPPAHPATRPTQWALNLLRQERYDDAFTTVATEPGPDALLLRAALLTDLGRLAEAERECLHLIDANGRDAGAHHLLSVCREGAGDLASAVAHASRAAFLDPGFAMPRLRLGLLARGRGDLATARNEFTAALMLLAGESDRRLLLFGGGFTRGTLTTLCRTGLDACGSAA